MKGLAHVIVTITGMIGVIVGSQVIRLENNSIITKLCMKYGLNKKIVTRSIIGLLAGMAISLMMHMHMDFTKFELFR